MATLHRVWDTDTELLAAGFNTPYDGEEELTPRKRLKRRRISREQRNRDEFDAAWGENFNPEDGDCDYE
jgi:hypothetical protein